MTSFACVLDTCPVNASTILALNNAKDPKMQNSLDFGMDLVMGFVRPFIGMRLRIGTTTELQMKICIVLGETNAPTQSPQQAAFFLRSHKQTKRHCKQLKRRAVKGAKIAKVKLNKELSQCQSCGKDTLSVNALNAIDLAIIFM